MITFIYSTMLKTPTSRKVALFDMDGVVLRHPVISQMVRTNIENYLRAHFPVNRLSATELNDRLYKSFGHTAIGFQKLYAPSLTVQEFNQAIYTPALYQALDDLRPTEDAWAIGQSQALLRQANIPLYLYTNAPRDWCAYWAKRLDIYECPEARWLSSDRVPLKPLPESYVQVAEIVAADFPNESPPELWFVDDSWMSLAPIVGESAWQPIWLTDSKVPYSPNMHQVHTLPLAAELIGGSR